MAMVLDDGRKIVDVAEAIGGARARSATGSDWRGSSTANAPGSPAMTAPRLSSFARRTPVYERDLLKRATAFWVKESGQ